MTFGFDKYKLLRENPKLPQKKKIWITGRNTLVVSLPKGWAEKDEEVELNDLGNMIILRRGESMEEPIEITYQEQNQVKYDIINTYLQGFKELRILIPDRDPRKIDEVKLLFQCLYGTKYKRSSLDKVALLFPTEVTNMGELLTMLFDLDSMVYTQVLKQMETSLPVEEARMEDTYRSINSLENDADAITSYAKRLLRRTLDNPELLRDVGLENLSQTIPYITIVENTERVIDHQHDLYLGMMNLNRFLRSRNETFIFSQPNEYGFKEYYIDAHKFLEKTCRNLENLDKNEVLEMLATKEYYIPDPVYGRLGYRSLTGQEGITPERRRKIFSLIGSMSGPYPVILAGMQTKIWGITGAATNIAEAVLHLKKHLP